VQARLEATRRHTAERFGIRDPDRYRLTVVPANTRPLENLPARNRGQFRDHLTRLITRSTQERTSSDDSALPAMEFVSAHEEAALAQACATCRGYCCHQGGNHAFLDAETIRRVRQQNPSLRPRDVLAAYMERLPNKHYRNGCVFHGEGGCTLPRSMRAHMCTAYYCSGLVDWRRNFSPNEEPRAFVISLNTNRIRSVAYIEAGAVLRLPASALPSTLARPLH
jgi:hypothetical protein